MLLFLIIILIITVLIYAYMLQSKFGSKPTGERLAKIQASANYKNGQFQNLHHTPALTEGASYTGVLKEFFFKKNSLA